MPKIERFWAFSTQLMPTRCKMIHHFDTLLQNDTRSCKQNHFIEDAIEPHHFAFPFKHPHRVDIQIVCLFVKKQISIPPCSPTQSVLYCVHNLKQRLAYAGQIDLEEYDNNLIRIASAMTVFYRPPGNRVENYCEQVELRDSQQRECAYLLADKISIAAPVKLAMHLFGRRDDSVSY